MKALFQRISLSDRTKIVAPSLPIAMSAFDPKRTSGLIGFCGCLRTISHTPAGRILL
jgi:hypothetical protein